MLAFVITGRRMDQILFPTAALLAGISLLLMERLPQDLVVQSVAGRELGLAAAAAGLDPRSASPSWPRLAIFVRSDGWLRRYKYTWAAVGIGLLLLVFVFGEVTGGARLTLRIGPVLRSAVGAAEGHPRRLPGRLPGREPGAACRARARVSGRSAAAAAVPAADARDVGPCAGDRDRPARPWRGAALLPRLPGLLYVATRRASYVVLGPAAVHRRRRIVLYVALPARPGPDRHLDQPVRRSRRAPATRSSARCTPTAAAASWARASAPGCRRWARCRRSRPSTPTSSSPRWPRRWACSARWRVLGLYVLIAQRGFRIAATAADDFRALLATGLTLVIVIQAAIIAGGNLRVVPLTGITLPLISYGGSSLLVNGAVIGLLLALSDRGVEPPPPGQRTERRVERIGKRARNVGGRVEEASRERTRPTRPVAARARLRAAAAQPHAVRCRRCRRPAAAQRAAAHCRQPAAPVARARDRLRRARRRPCLLAGRRGAAADRRSAQPARPRRRARRRRAARSTTATATSSRATSGGNGEPQREYPYLGGGAGRRLPQRHLRHGRARATRTTRS